MTDRQWLGRAAAADQLILRQSSRDSLIEVPPPVDTGGQSVDPDVSVLEPLLEKELGKDIAAIHWGLALITLHAVTGMPTLVGLVAEPETPRPD